MDQKRLMLAIAISIAILLGFQLILPPPTPSRVQTAEQVSKNTPTTATPRPTFDPASPGTQPVTIPPPREVPRLPIAAPKVQGSVSLLGARIDDLVLRDYHVEVERTSPLVRLLEPRADPQPYWAQFGWSSDTPGVRLPDNDTMWTASGGPVSPGRAYVVGERGPELFVPTGSGRVVANGSGAGGAREVRVAITVNSGSAAAPEALTRSSRQIARAVRAALRED